MYLCILCIFEISPSYTPSSNGVPPVCTLHSSYSSEVSQCLLQHCSGVGPAVLSTGLDGEKSLSGICNNVVPLFPANQSLLSPSL